MAEITDAGCLEWRLVRQLDTIVPEHPAPTEIEHRLIDLAVFKVDRCVKDVIGRNGRPFDQFVSWEYTIFLYFLAQTISRELGDQRLATRLFLLNKALNGIDLFYDVDLSEVFLLGHTVGLVFAKANYGSHCIFHQNCTVGRILDKRPTLEDFVVMYPGSSITGSCHIRTNTVISAGVHLINTDTPGNCIIFNGESGKPIIKEISEIYAYRYYNQS